MADTKVKCGDCAYFVRDGKCDAQQSERYKRPGRPFGEAPFWVWSDCYSDKEQVRANVETMCSMFDPKQSNI
jgi:hypothetical protein